MAGDMATMFDELKALADRHADLQGDGARLQAGSAAPLSIKAVCELS
jgi:hypothetical protein